MIPNVQSSLNLTNDLVDLFGSLAPSRSTEPSPSNAVDAPRKAIFAIHGISPQQRYAFQDQVASSLQSFLNSLERVNKTSFQWKVIVHWPYVFNAGANEQIRPSALRLYRSDDNADDPKGSIYDVYEGYWSPLSKGKTNISSVLQWLLKSTFLPTSSTANLPCTRDKLISDLVYLARLLVILVAALIAAVVVGILAWTQFSYLVLSPGDVPSFWQLLRDPLGVSLRLPLFAYVQLLINMIAAYVLMQLLVSYRVTQQRALRTRELTKDADRQGSQFVQDSISASTFHKWTNYIMWSALIVLLAISIVISSFAGQLDVNHRLAFISYGVLVASTVGFLSFARSAANSIVENVLGDLQIYTTHDQNSTFYTIRANIINSVSSSLIGLLRAVEKPHVDTTAGPSLAQTLEKATEPPEPFYDRVHVFGHSLGSTIGMDVLILLRQLVQEEIVSQDQWNRIRSFTTFGTSLEKTRFFFDVRQPTISAAQAQWANDVYGRFFTCDRSTLDGSDNEQGIYWANIWYLRDIVANAIVSYTSDVSAGDSFKWGQASHPICQNHELAHDTPRFAWVHSDYLNDPLFWEKVAPIITSDTQRLGG